MDHPDPQPTRAVAARLIVRQHAGSTLLEAAVLLFVGFYFLGGLSGISDSQIYNTSVTAVRLAFQGGGVAMLVVAMLCWIGWRYALAVDAVVSAILGLAFLITGGIWLVNGDMMGVLILIFGVMDLSSARASWARHLFVTSSSFSAGAAFVPEAEAAPDPGTLPGEFAL